MSQLKESIWDSTKFGNSASGFFHLPKYFFSRLTPSGCTTLKGVALATVGIAYENYPLGNGTAPDLPAFPTLPGKKPKTSCI